MQYKQLHVSGDTSLCIKNIEKKLRKCSQENVIQEVVCPLKQVEYSQGRSVILTECFSIIERVQFEKPRLRH